MFYDVMVHFVLVLWLIHLCKISARTNVVYQSVGNVGNS